MNYFGYPDRSHFGNQYGTLGDPIDIISQVPVDIIQFIKNLYQTDRNYLKTNVTSIEREISFEYPTSSRVETLSFLSAIIYPNPEELRLFFQHNHVYLHGVLYACKVTYESFDKDNQLSLEVGNDPESGEKTLGLFVRSNSYPDDFHDRLKVIRKNYRSAGFLDSIDFAITTDYQPPLSLS
jgi:hypothetical protein